MWDDWTWWWSRLKWFWNDWRLGRMLWVPNRWLANKLWSIERINMRRWRETTKFLKQAQKNSTPAASVYASNIANMAHKDLSHLTYFNNNKKDHYITSCPESRKKKTPLKSNASTVEEKTISPISILKRKTWSQKTSDSLNDYYVDRLMWMMTPLLSEKKSVSALLD